MNPENSFQMNLLTVILLMVKVLSICAGVFNPGKKQSIAVSGHLECNGKPASDVKVKLYDKEILLDYKLDEGRTDSNGNFYLRGSKKEITNIDPKINIYHKCDYDGLCFKKFDITIPDEYITQSGTPQSTFNIGRINLSGSFTGETIDCLN
ncbi:Transthyretin-like family protein [Necator americanus]|uniref:Transthyretin-like family protein n=1 Tax=Necator americanus TaxID=51031 RepID=W2SKF6_NECAM|nr:Transthyretin-like family protein [Necator americanus]ETN70154.1 Transthyretin-like family protein [Necator americanus]